MDKQIADLLRSRDLLEARDCLERIQGYLNGKSIDRQAFCKELAVSIKAWMTGEAAACSLVSVDPDTGMNLRIYPAEKSVPVFLASNGFATGKTGVTRRKIQELIADIDETISPPRGQILTVEKEMELFTLLTEKFAYWQTVRLPEPVIVLNIRNSHKYFGSISGSDEDATAYIIYLFATQNGAIAPAYMLLHELGHILQTVLTGSAEVVPEEFMEMHYSIPHAVFLDQDSEVAANYFADTFAAAAMHGTDLARYSPLGFPDRLMDTWEDFFLRLFKGTSRNSLSSDSSAVFLSGKAEDGVILVSSMPTDDNAASAL